MAVILLFGLFGWKVALIYVVTGPLIAIFAGWLIAKGKTIKIGRTLCLGEAAIENEEGRILAHGTVTMMVVPNIEIKEDFDLPPKRSS